MYSSGSVEELSVETAARAGKCQISNKHFTNVTSVTLLVCKPTWHHVHMWWQWSDNLHRQSSHQMYAQKMFVWACHHADPTACKTCPRCQLCSLWSRVTER